jgi:hypothetical protein
MATVRSRWATARTVGVACVFAVVFGVTVPAAAATSGPSTAASTQSQIARAFGALRDIGAVRRDRRYLEGYDVEMRLALQQAQAGQADEDEGASAGGTAVRITLRTGRADVVRTGEATVPLTITFTMEHPPPPSFSDRFTAVALEVGHRWQVSWTTMCLLVESSGEQCPLTPKGVVAGDILPAPDGAPLAPTDLTTGLVDPRALAPAPGGGVLIADQGREQILKWDDGVISVVAGNGLAGFSGDGGPAVDAELDQPGEMAVGPGGTIYVADQANNRVRAIAPDGTISAVAGNGAPADGLEAVGNGGPATSAPLSPDGVAVSQRGVLYISSGSAIREVAPDGLISTLVQGNAPYGDVELDGAPTAFMPGDLAVEGGGDVVVFSFSPKLLLEVTPGGQVTQLAQDYADALSPAPDGSVLVAEHGMGTQQVVGSTVRVLQAFSMGEVPGLSGGLVPEAITETPEGTVYVATEPGDGMNDQTGLYAITHGAVAAVPVSSTLVSTLPGVGAAGFGAAVYPGTRAASGADAALTACPSWLGVEPFDAAATAKARAVLGLWNTSLSYDLRASDRSWWPGDVGTFTSGPFGGRQTVGPAAPASKDLYAPAVAAACGAALVKESLAVVMTPSPYSFATEHLFLLDRDGTPLVYFSTS